MIAPDSEDAVVEAVLAAGREPLLVCGNASKTGMLRPIQAARTLSTRGLTGITLYSPQELILSARSGTPMAEIEAAVAVKGQHLIAEPPDFTGLFGAGTQTLGGVVATNLSGPRRVAWGAMRDHVMGVRAVNGIGEAIHSGGRVLKNVTGLDLCKLLTGSYGTLAVMTEITLKVLPAPPRCATLVLAGLDPVAGVAALAAGLGSPYAVSGAAYLPEANDVSGLGRFRGPVAVLRIEDFAESVVYRSGRLRHDLAEFGDATLLGDDETRAAWGAVRDAGPLIGHAGAIWRVSVRPSAGPRVAAAVAAERWFMDWGGGLVWLAGPATEAMHRQVMAAAQAARGTWTLFHGPDELRAAVDVLPPEPEPLARIRREVKAAFDPGFILNRGRMYAGL